MKDRHTTPAPQVNQNVTPQPASAAPAVHREYPSLKRRFMLVTLRQRLRGLCDKTGLGPSTGERLCCALIIAVVPFVVSFILAFAFKEPAGYAALQGVGAFVIVAMLGVMVIGFESDEALESRRGQIALELPQAKAAWLERKNANTLEPAAEDESATVAPVGDKIAGVRKTTKRCPYCAEVIAAEARKCKHCGEMFDGSSRSPAAVAQSAVSQSSVVHVHVRARKSGGVAAMLEVIFGLFFNTFGIGHMYAGNVGTGLFLMFGYWFFLFVNIVVALFTCGIWLYPALVVVPAVWFLLMVLSPIVAASAASDY